MDFQCPKSAMPAAFSSGMEWHGSMIPTGGLPVLETSFIFFLPHCDQGAQLCMMAVGGINDQVGQGTSGVGQGAPQ